MKPVIGIGGDVKSDPEPAVRLKLNYVDAVRRAGGVPVILPPVDADDVALLLSRVDGVVLTGGADIDVRPLGAKLHPQAELVHERRQSFDLALARALLTAPIPALGICLGMQELGVAAGAKLHQHLPDAGYTNLLDHRAAHEVEVAAGSRLAEVLGTARAKIVSHHHQALASAPTPFRGVASAPDGVLEAIELPGERFLVGVQWHPERSPDAPDSQRLFRALVDAAKR